MDEFRLTLISDPTDEFPNNTNHNFKIRLPSIISLTGTNWKTSLWSLSVPDVGHSHTLISQNADLQVVTFTYTLTSRYRPNPSASDMKIGWKKVTDNLKLKDVMKTDDYVVSGTQLWHNIMHRMETKIQAKIQAESNSKRQTFGDASTVSLKKEWKPSFTWDQQNLVLSAVPKEDVVTLDAVKTPISQFAIHTTLAKLFGFVTHKADNSYTLGPNVHFHLPQVTYTSSTQPTNSQDRYPWAGDHYLGIHPDTFTGTELFKVSNDLVYFARRCKWTFRNLDSSFSQLVGDPKKTVLVYSNLVQSTIVGSERHPLLRKVQLERTGSGRSMVEPSNHEWIPVRNNQLEVIEVQLSDSNGDLIVLPPGKTILTVGVARL